VYGRPSRAAAKARSGRDSLQFCIYKSGVRNIVRAAYKTLHERAQLRRVDAIAIQGSSARNLHHRGEIGEHGPEVRVPLIQFVAERTGDGVLQHHLVHFQALAIDLRHSRGIEVHRHHADQHQHTNNQVQYGYP